MSATQTLRCFAYGEHLDTLAQRSLGYRLLAPARLEPWCAEVEALARRLQTTPYPDHWPPTDLFCSVLLADGSRLIAVARYGLADHTPSSRRGGLELIGTVGPPNIGVEQALAVYHWLRERRRRSDDLHTLGGTAALAEVLASVPPQQPSGDPVPILPIRLWQEGALLFAATAPSEPDHRIGLLEQGASGEWQWLPLVGADFPLATYAQRGPLIAWTPHLAGVALKVDPKSAPPPGPRPRGRRIEIVLAAVLALLAVLTAVNLWMTRELGQRGARQEHTAAAPGVNAPSPSDQSKGAVPQTSAEQARAAFADALYALLAERGGQPEWDSLREQLLTRYDRAARDHKDLRLPDVDVKGRAAVGAVALLSERSAGQIEDTIKKALTKRGYDADLIDLACQRVREQLIEEARKGP
jgi:hypothetical protein